MKDFDQYYQFFKDYLARTTITGSDYQRLTGQANVTAEQLRAIIDNSDRFNADFARFKDYYDSGDMVNATPTALKLQKQFDAMNGSSRQLTLTRGGDQHVLQNTSVNTNRLDEGINTLNVYMDRMNGLNALPKSLLGDTDLTLETSQVNVSTGEVVAFIARLTSNDTAVGRRAGRACTSMVSTADRCKSPAATASASCTTASTRAATTARSMRSLTSTRRATNYTPAVSNDVELNRRPIATDLTMTCTPENRPVRGHGAGAGPADRRRRLPGARSRGLRLLREPARLLCDHGQQRPLYLRALR